MFSILLAIIYVAFISLGLPDAILGSAWPSMQEQLGVPVSYAGVVTMIISAGTIVSSFNSVKVISRFGTGVVTAVSVAMTAVALLGFSCSDSFIQLCLWAVPYGLGAGSVDAALNNFVALHYKSKHMSWLHCFWGLGVTFGPYIMGYCLSRGMLWNNGYRFVGIFQIALTIILVLSLPMWKIGKIGNVEEEKKPNNLKFAEILKIKGAKNILIAFFFYCAVEATAGLWASSYMVMYKGINVERAANWAALFYIGITLGRFISGFIADRLGDKNMIRLGLIICLGGTIALALPLGEIVTLAALVIVGLGCAPIYPSVIHATPDNFGAENSQALMGVQMACAYCGMTLMPPLFGLIAQHITISLYPFYLMIMTVGMIVLTEDMNRNLRRLSEQACL